MVEEMIDRDLMHKMFVKSLIIKTTNKTADSCEASWTLLGNLYHLLLIPYMKQVKLITIIAHVCHRISLKRAHYSDSLITENTFLSIIV